MNTNVRQGMLRRQASIEFNVNTILTNVGSIPTSDVFKFIHGGHKNISGRRVFEQIVCWLRVKIKLCILNIFN